MGRSAPWQPWSPSRCRPLRIRSGDNPESVRLRKYLTGTNFLVGGVEVAVGLSPRRLVWSRDKSRLYRYESTARVRPSVPLVLVYALILRPYILDLVPGRSLVEYLVGQGFDVYLLDWGVPDALDRGGGIVDNVLEVVPEAVEEVLRRSSADQVTLVGHCQGGTTSAIYAALFPSRAVRNLVLLASPVDFPPARTARRLDVVDAPARGRAPRCWRRPPARGRPTFRPWRCPSPPAPWPPHRA